MTDRPDYSRQDRGKDVRSIAWRSRRQRLTPERTAEIRLRILDRSYDSAQIAKTIASKLLLKGDL